jgi:hypothetical protein
VSGTVEVQGHPGRLNWQWLCTTMFSHPVRLDECAQIFEFDAEIICSPTTSCVGEEDGLSGGHELGVDIDDSRGVPPKRRPIL